MGVEVATYIGDLVSTNPGSGDLVSQGDDHLRLVKAVLQNTFPGAEKAFYLPVSAAKSADFTVLAADMNKTFLVTTTSGLINMTLPTLASGDAGWECFMMKATTDVNPCMIKPPTGTLTSGAISGLAAARRCIPSSKVSCYWTGTAWVIGRSQGVGGPVGTCIEYHGSTLPFGYEWPNGQTLASASTVYPEINAVLGSGVTIDKRGRYSATLDNLGGSAAGRITTAGGGVDGSTLFAVGGGQNITLITANLPPYTPSGSISASGSVNISVVNFGGNTSVPNSLSFGGSLSVSVSATFAGSAQGGTSTAVKVLPPTIMVAQILIVE